jgi:hypothetical protein
MSVDPKQLPLEKIKVIGFKVTEHELQNIIYIPCNARLLPARSCQTRYHLFVLKVPHQLCIGHCRLKKQQSEMTQQEIAAEKEQAYEKNSTA